jgi:hypothetical protein
MHDKSYMPSSTDRANDSLFSAIQTENAEIIKVALEEVLGNKGKYKKIASDKDSSTFRRATESYLAGSSYSKVVGRNTSENAKENFDNANTVRVSSNHLRGMLASDKNASNSVRAKHIRNLSYLLGEKVDEYSNLGELKSKSLEELGKIEDDLINGLIRRISNGDLNLLS